MFFNIFKNSKEIFLVKKKIKSIFQPFLQYFSNYFALCSIDLSIDFKKIKKDILELANSHTLSKSAKVFSPKHSGPENLKKG